MRTTLLAAALLLASLVPALADDEPSDADLAKRPISGHKGNIGYLLRRWWGEGTAAGNVGDWYDNRDRGHSQLDLSLFPQLRAVRYSKEDADARRDFGPQTQALPKVVFGNSSTSAPPESSGSNVRSLYCSHQGLKILEQQYLKNNLYVYPEHRDHDPGRNGVGGGYGDLLPTNTPYLITSQGSSGSDTHFLWAAGYALAAFRPEVKKKLVETGLLMPTVQMLLRWSNTPGKTMAEYYTARAHPTAFDTSALDLAKMADRAHDIRLANIPPMVKLAVVKEEKAVVGRDFFETQNLSEQHSDTACVIARVWRGPARTRTLTVSAEKSFDVNGYPLTFRWELVRGDEKRVKITPKNKAGSVAEITVEYHERRPVAPRSPLESNRVDIGVFASNGVYPSAPGFITFFTLDSEGRTYDAAGRLVEIGYGMGFTELKVADPAKLAAELSRDGLAAKALGVTAAQRADLDAVVKDLEPITDQAQRQKLLAAKRDALGASPLVFSGRLLEAALKEPTFWNTHRPAFRGHLRKPGLEPLRKRLSETWTKLVQLGIVTPGAEEVMVFQPALPGAGPAVQRLSAFERAIVEEFNGRLVAELLLPGVVTSTFHVNLVDPRLTTKKSWRDVYQYEGDTLTGWKRYLYGGKERVVEFTPEGWAVVEKDEQGRPRKARTVRYGLVQPKERTWVNTNPLLHVWGDEVITFAYEGKKRVIKSRTKLIGT
jgi:hypothetical protein